MLPYQLLPAKDNVSLTKQLSEGFKRSVYLNEYKSETETKEVNNQTVTKFPLNISFQVFNKLFVLAFNNDNTDANRIENDSH